MIMKNNQIQKAMHIKGKSFIAIFLVFTTLSFFCKYGKAQEVDVKHRKLKTVARILLSGEKYFSEENKKWFEERKNKKWWKSLLSREYFSQLDKNWLASDLKTLLSDILSRQYLSEKHKNWLKSVLRWLASELRWMDTELSRQYSSESDEKWLQTKMRDILSRQHFFESEKDKKTLEIVLKWMHTAGSPILLRESYFSEKEGKRIETVLNKLENERRWRYFS